MKKHTLLIITLFSTKTFLYAAGLTPHQKNPISTHAIFMHTTTSHTSLTQTCRMICMPINDIPRCAIPICQTATGPTYFGNVIELATRSIRFIGIRYSDGSTEIDESMPENTAVTKLPFFKKDKLGIQLKYLSDLRAKNSR